MTQVLVYSAEAEKMLKELAESSEKPENHIIDMKVAASSWDQELFKRTVQVVDALQGPMEILVIFSITNAQKSDGTHLLVRHMSLSRVDRKDFPPQLAVAMIGRALGFQGTFLHWACREHPQVPYCLVFIQKYEPLQQSSSSASESAPSAVE